MPIVCGRLGRVVAGRNATVGLVGARSPLRRSPTPPPLLTSSPSVGLGTLSADSALTVPLVEVRQDAEELNRRHPRHRIQGELLHGRRPYPEVSGKPSEPQGGIAGDSGVQLDRAGCEGAVLPCFGAKVGEFVGNVRRFVWGLWWHGYHAHPIGDAWRGL